MSLLSPHKTPVVGDCCIRWAPFAGPVCFSRRDNTSNIHSR